jgi:hypothetical protein
MILSPDMRCVLEKMRHRERSFSGARSPPFRIAHGAIARHGNSHSCGYGKRADGDWSCAPKRCTIAVIRNEAEDA